MFLKTIRQKCRTFIIRCTYNHAVKYAVKYPYARGCCTIRPQFHLSLAPFIPGPGCRWCTGSSQGLFVGVPHSLLAPFVGSFVASRCSSVASCCSSVASCRSPVASRRSFIALHRSFVASRRSVALFCSMKWLANNLHEWARNEKALQTKVCWASRGRGVFVAGGGKPKLAGHHEGRGSW